MSAPRLTFLGATGTVTGSRTLLESPSARVLVDCGLFQGLKQLRLRNWTPIPADPARLDCVILTHAHIDHSGYLPVLVRDGFRGRIHCSAATRDLCRILLPDAGRLQEEEAEYANRHGFSRHKPALPLYTEHDAMRCLEQFQPVPLHQPFRLGDGDSFRLLRAGHIVGASIAELTMAGRKVVFSGDLGRPHDPIMSAPEGIASADYLVLESTYGNKRHNPVDPAQTLAEVIQRTAARGGVVVVPSFAVGRAQELLYYIHQLRQSGRIPDLPVYLNSPMAVDAGAVLRAHTSEHRLSPAQCDAVMKDVRVITSVEESKELNTRRGPMVIVAASGMATGGRVVHHLKSFAPDPKNTILLAGFQAAGTRGAALRDGAETVKIHGEYVPVRAEVVAMDNLSAHADADEILVWLDHFTRPPRRIFINHGEPVSADALRHRIEEEKGWDCTVPDYRETFELR